MIVVYAGTFCSFFLFLSFFYIYIYIYIYICIYAPLCIDEAHRLLRLFNLTLTLTLTLTWILHLFEGVYDRRLRGFVFYF
jgi:hypothetical protein